MMMSELKVFKLADLPRERRLHEKRMERWSIRTKQAQIVFGIITPQPLEQQRNHRDPHDHPYDMLLVVLNGTMMQDVEGTDYKLDAGTAMVVPAYFMHRGYAYGSTPAYLFEVFAPARRDYIDLVEYQTDFSDKGEHWVKEGTFTTNSFAGNDPTKPRLPVYKLAELPAETRSGFNRVQRRSIRTKFAQVIWTEMTPGTDGSPQTPARTEKLAYDKLIIVNKGGLRLKTAQRDYNLPEGTCVVVPPHLPHSVEFERVPTSLIEVYSPPRRDYLPLVKYQSEQFGDEGEVWVEPS
jgi:mannose-6-phosphate isomerase-like protein (cupin superfamily)